MSTGSITPTTALLAAALDVTSLRQQVIAHNIANASVSGFVPTQLSFSSQYETVRNELLHGRPLMPSDLASLGVEQVRLVPIEEPQQEGVHLDEQVSALAKNSLDYQVLLKGLSRHLSSMLLAASDGKK